MHKGQDQVHFVEVYKVFSNKVEQMIYVSFEKNNSVLFSSTKI